MVPKTEEAISQPVTTSHECRKIYLSYGYKDRENLQIRLEPDNEHVYLSYTENEGRTIKSTTIPVDRLLSMIVSTVIVDTI